MTSPIGGILPVGGTFFAFPPFAHDGTNRIVISNCMPFCPAYRSARS